MKKFAIIILTITLALSVSACKPKVVKPGPTTPTNTPGTSPSAPVGEGEVSTGFCIETSLSDSTDATADKGGAAKCESAFYAVTVDADGVIESCVIDAVQSTIEFSADGKLTTDTATEFPSKNELGKAYGLAQASPIGKEWNEQAKAFAQYCVGKTAQEVSGIAMTADGKAADADLASSVTIRIGGFVAGVEAAAKNAHPLGAKHGDTLKITSMTNISSSGDATADGDGTAQVDTTVAVITLDGDKVTSCYIDGVQASVKFDAKGKITSDINADIASKNTLGDNYGMKSASSIGREWYEQAAAFASYVTGKTIADVGNIAVSEGKATDADLASSVTIRITNFIALIEKAA